MPACACACACAISPTAPYDLQSLNSVSAPEKHHAVHLKKGTFSKSKNSLTPGRYNGQLGKRPLPPSTTINRGPFKASPTSCVEALEGKQHVQLPHAVDGAERQPQLRRHGVGKNWATLLHTSRIKGHPLCAFFAKQVGLVPCGASNVKTSVF